ncbi:MAG: radical SAM protein [bacterium]|nr:radical SAM protein [bacterium]
MKISKYNLIKKYAENVLIYNAFSKASIFLEKNADVSFIEDIDNFNKLNVREKKMLYENGFIVDDDRDEFSEIKYIYEQKFFETDFFNIILVPSLACNFKCPYCCEKGYSCGKENIKKYFAVLKKYAEKNFQIHNHVQISLFGGEPLLFVDECLEFLNWVKNDSNIKNYEYFTSIVTNGSLLTESILVKLLQHNLYALQITIDSDKENHDTMRIFKNGAPSFDFLIDKINTLVPLTTNLENFKFILRINLNNTNVDKIKCTLEQINKNTRKHIYLMFRIIYNTHSYKEQNLNNITELKPYFEIGDNLGFNVLREKYNYQSCEACGDRKMFYLMPDLSIWKCINDIGYTDACIGKIDNNGKIILKPERVIAWYKSCMSAFADPECIKCKMLPDCFGGCPLYKCKNGAKSCRSFDMASLPYTF